MLKSPKRKFESLSAVGALVAAYVFGMTSAAGLQYQQIPLDQSSVALTFTGPIVPGDFDRFAAFLESVPRESTIKVIFLDSGGGNLVEASKLATLFYKTQTVVVVPSGSQCSSACFLLFAAAARRAAAPDALIGVHSVSDNGKENIGSMAFTTLFAREAASYGVPASIIGKIVQTSPDRVTWLDPSDLEAMHVQMLEATAPSPQDANASAPHEPPAQSAFPSAVPVQGSGDSWIQIYSRALYSEAVSLATNYKLKYDNTRVFKCDNGWYALVLGPFDATTAVETRDKLVAGGDIPRDSLVTRGASFLQVAWSGDTDPSASTPSPREERAVQATRDFFRTWTQPNRAAISFLEKVYSPRVIYFGKKASKEYVIREKQQFAERWPKRAYSVRPGSVSTSCDSQNDSCTVSGIVDWRVSSPSRSANASGSARFQLTFLTDTNSPTLVSEWSEVLSRDTIASP